MVRKNGHKGQQFTLSVPRDRRIEEVHIALKNHKIGYTVEREILVVF